MLDLSSVAGRRNNRAITIEEGVLRTIRVLRSRKIEGNVVGVVGRTPPTRPTVARKRRYRAITTDGAPVQDNSARVQETCSTVANKMDESNNSNGSYGNYKILIQKMVIFNSFQLNLFILLCSCFSKIIF